MAVARSGSYGDALRGKLAGTRATGRNRSLRSLSGEMRAPTDGDDRRGSIQVNPSPPADGKKAPLLLGWTPFGSFGVCAI
jgi:hypothetical protein